MEVIMNEFPIVDIVVDPKTGHILYQREGYEATEEDTRIDTSLLEVESEKE